MRKVLLIVLCVICFNNSKSQTYVTIPDPNFVNWLQLMHPSCMVGNQMDITCSAIQNATSIIITGLSISDLTGIEYFTSLEVLNCNTNLLTTLPPLPATLLSLECYDNALTSLPVLPDSLTNLGCRFNQLTALPTLPLSLVNLDFSLNQVATLASPLPTTLKYLDCGYNYLTTLPTLPNALISLNCTGNLLTALPSPLPNSIEILYCGSNQFTGLPALPDSLLQLQCHSNQLTSLPLLPNKLLIFWCFDNLLTILPALPPLMSELQCSSNDLLTLPALPNSLYVLVCNDNNISCFPIFPSSIVPFGLILGTNPFSCLPNYISAMDSTLLAYPICTSGDTINNPDGCNNANGIMGSIYRDLNLNCVLNSSDDFWENVPLKLYDSTGSLIAQTYSLSNGYYYFPATAGVYTVKIDTTSLPLMVGCLSLGTETTVTLTSSTTLIQNTDFALICKPGFDIGVQSISTSGWVFPGQLHNLKIVAGDLTTVNGDHCLANISGTVKVTVTGSSLFNGVSPGALTPSIAGNIYTYTISNFDSVNLMLDFNLQFGIPTTAVAGDQICVDVEVIAGSGGDNDPVNNTLYYCYEVINSYDPNMKEVFPVDVATGYQDWFTYTIHYQNTGNAPAMNIRLEDTLDMNLDLETFQMLSSSHFNSVFVDGNALAFEFPGIMLPDSTSDPEGSKGFVQYRLKPKSGLPGGTKLYNTAFIYFDYNAAVVTNTTLNEFVEPLTVNYNTDMQMMVYPNPGKGTFFVEFKENAAPVPLVGVYNILGELVLSFKADGSKVALDLNNQPNGIYFLRALNAEGWAGHRIIKQ
ncbi:MAG: T9SS type A sorting domain-containing protein [Bacteroidota bacterium]|nr:T9SS type A sorting domain-containing protein [Bacteroidota bacterium]